MQNYSASNASLPCSDGHDTTSNCDVEIRRRCLSLLAQQKLQTPVSVNILIIHLVHSRNNLIHSTFVVSVLINHPTAISRSVLLMAPEHTHTQGPVFRKIHQLRHRLSPVAVIIRAHRRMSRCAFVNAGDCHLNTFQRPCIH